MAQPTHAPARSQPTPLPHPTVRALVALVSFVRRYLGFGAPRAVPPPDAAFQPFLGLDPSRLQQESFVSTILCHALAWFLVMAARQRQRHRPACGGWAHPNLLSKEDLQQEPRDPATLKRRSTVYLCALLREELLLLLRLLRAAQRAYWRDPAGEDWQQCHYAAMQVLIRITHIGTRLRKHANRWYAEQCVRRELYVLWFDQFGPNAILPDGAYHWLETIPIPAKYERRILKRLLAERKWGYEIPPAFARLYRRWEQGLEYPEVKAPQPPPLCLKTHL